MKRKETTKNSTKKRLSFSFFKKHRALSVALIIFAVGVASFLVVNYGRYAKDYIQMYYLRTKNFYFSSDKLTITGKTYEINPWSGTIPYTIDINMSSMLNSLKGTNSDITYNVECVSDSNSICYFENRGTTEISRTVSSSNHADNFVVTVEVKDGVHVSDGDVISVSVVATSTTPYEETLSATFNLVIGNYGVNYYIEDVLGRLYLDAFVSNTLPTDPITVRLDITDVSKYSFDMTNIILEADGTEVYKDANQNITGIKFVVNPKSSMMVRYYKNNPNEDKSYTGEGTPAIRFTLLS